MEKLIKRPLKITAAAMFMVAMSYGVSTNSEVSESGKTSNVNLSALSSVSAQGEIGAGRECKSDNRCWNGNTIECDEFGTGSECVCYVC